MRLTWTSETGEVYAQQQGVNVTKLVDFTTDDAAKKVYCVGNYN